MCPPPSAVAGTALLVLAGLLAVAAAPTPAPAAGAAAPSGAATAARSVAEERGVAFRVLTYNVAGLPAGLSYSDPGPRLPAIGRRAAAYDIVLVQEAFTGLDVLRDASGHPELRRGSGPRSGWARLIGRLCGRCGSGLALLTGRRGEEILAGRAGRYARCSGWGLRPMADGSDCWASKGWQHARLALADGIAVDLWNTHLDAGVLADDLAARGAQLDELARAMAESRGRAVVVGGDFNLGAELPEEARLLERFRRRLGLRDTGARTRDTDRWPRRIDHLFYRSGERVALELERAGESREFRREGRPLSDHPALFARFRARARGGATAEATAGAPARD